MEGLPDGWEQWTPEQRERWIIAMREIAAMRRNAAASARVVERSGGRGD